MFGTLLLLFASVFLCFQFPGVIKQHNDLLVHEIVELCSAHQNLHGLLKLGTVSWTCNECMSVSKSKIRAWSGTFSFLSVGVRHI